MSCKLEREAREDGNGKERQSVKFFHEVPPLPKPFLHTSSPNVQRVLEGEPEEEEGKGL